MTHEELRNFPIYRDACLSSQAMCREVVNHIETHYGIQPTGAAQGHLQWHPNFARIQTLGKKLPILTINLSGPETGYGDLCIDHLFRPPWRGMTRLRLDGMTAIQLLVAAIDRSYQIRSRRE